MIAAHHILVSSNQLPYKMLPDDQVSFQCVAQARAGEVIADTLKPYVTKITLPKIHKRRRYDYGTDESKQQYKRLIFHWEMDPRPANAVGGSCMGGIIGGILGIVLGFAIAAKQNEGYVSHTLVDLIAVPAKVLVYFLAISGCGIVGAIGGAAIGAGVATIPRGNEADKLAMPPDQVTRSSPDSIEQDLTQLRQRIIELEKEQAENQE